MRAFRTIDRSFSDSDAAGVPCISTSPPLGVSSNPRICSSVLLPLPLLPTSATTSPAFKSSDTPLSTGSVCFPSTKWRLIFSARSAAAGFCAAAGGDETRGAGAVALLMAQTLNRILPRRNERGNKRTQPRRKQRNGGDQNAVEIQRAIGNFSRRQRFGREQIEAAPS